MKKLVSLFIILFSTAVFAALPDIVALVNDNPITKYDFQSRKKMMVILNNIDVSKPGIQRRLSSDILNVLIEEELLNQHAENVGGDVGDKEIDNAIFNIEQRNKMPKGGMVAYLKEKGVEVASFRKQIKGELIKNNIITSLTHSISVSPLETDVALIYGASGEIDFDVEAWVFTSHKGTGQYLRTMQKFQKNLPICRKMEDKLYSKFADAEKFDRRFKNFPEKLQTIILDTRAGASSSVYKEGDKFKMIFVCKKGPSASNSNANQVKAFLSNKKMSKKAGKFFKDLRAKAYIKIMIPN